MMKIILMGFVFGALTLTYPVAVPTVIWICSGILAVFLLWMITASALSDVFHAQPFKFLAVQIVLFITAVLFGHGYAAAQLEQALQLRLTEPTTLTTIVKVKGISDGVEDKWRQVVEVQNNSQNTKAFDVKNLDIENHHVKVKWLLYSAYSWDQAKKLPAPAMQPNQLWQVTVKLKPAHTLASFGAFDSEKWLLEQGVVATGTVQQARLLSPEEIAKLGLKPPSWFERFDRAIQLERLSVRHHFQQFNSPASGVMLGLLTGDRSLIDTKTTQLYQQMGISHLLAISGPHVVLAALMITLICRWLLNLFPALFLVTERSRWLLPIFVTIVVLYACLAGFDLPAQRTALMVGLTAGLFWWRKRYSPMLILLIAASVILAFDPLTVLSAAFWLSFGAVAILLSMSQKQTSVVEHPTWQINFKKNTHQFVQLQWRLFVLLTPLVLFVFHQVSLLSPLINLIAIPFLTLVIVPLNLLAWALSAISWDIADVIWYVLLAVLSCFNAALEWVSELFPNALTPFYLTTPALLALTLALIILLLPKGVLPRWWVVVLLIPVFWPYRLTAPLMLHVLDVGQGLSVILQTQHHSILVDTGAKLPSQQEGMGEKVVLPALQSLGIRRLDKLMLTHLDNDHSGGAPAVMAGMPVIQLTSSANFDPYPTYICEAGQQWVWDSISFKVLSPRIDDRQNLSANDASCVLMVEVPAQSNSPAQRVLIMGDAGFYPEFKLLQQGTNLKADILVLGHHGSSGSSSSAFLQAVAPKRAVVSAGYLNRYHHPTPIVLKRLQEQDVVVDSTISGGTLSYYLGQKHLNPLRYRDQAPWLQRNELAQ